MRGKVARQIREKFVKGITPAYAGKSCPARIPDAVYRDHPRLCGEKFQRRATLPALKGSPPPMRGKASQFENLGNTE